MSDEKTSWFPNSTDCPKLPSAAWHVSISSHWKSIKLPPVHRNMVLSPNENFTGIFNFFYFISLMPQKWRQFHFCALMSISKRNGKTWEVIHSKHTTQLTRNHYVKTSFWRTNYVFIAFCLQDCSWILNNALCFAKYWKLAWLLYDWEDIAMKPVYNDHLVGYFSAFWSCSRWPRAT